MSDPGSPEMQSLLQQTWSDAAGNLEDFLAQYPLPERKYPQFDLRNYWPDVALPNAQRYARSTWHRLRHWLKSYRLMRKMGYPRRAIIQHLRSGGATFA